MGPAQDNNVIMKTLLFALLATNYSNNLRGIFRLIWMRTFIDKTYHGNIFILNFATSKQF